MANEELFLDPAMSVGGSFEYVIASAAKRLRVDSPIYSIALAGPSLSYFYLKSSQQNSLALDDTTEPRNIGQDQHFHTYSAYQNQPRIKSKVEVRLRKDRYVYAMPVATNSRRRIVEGGFQ